VTTYPPEDKTHAAFEMRAANVHGIWSLAPANEKTDAAGPKSTAAERKASPMRPFPKGDPVS
jgi:hypothetical protein